MPTGLDDLYDLVDPELADPIDWGHELRRHEVSVILSPRQWAQFDTSIELEWGKTKFDRDNKGDVPDDVGGVYSFVVEPSIAAHPACSYLFYIGKAEDQSLRDRYLQYFDKAKRKSRKELPKQVKVRRMLREWPDHLWFCFAPIDNPDDIEPVERRLIHCFVPWVNDLVYPGELRAAVKAYP